MEYFIQQLINGLTLGSIYGLIAIGYTMVYGIIGMINFAHGDVFMVGCYIALIAFLALIAIGVTAVPVALLLVLIIAMALTALYGWTVERLAYRPLRGAPRLAPLITAIGVSIILQHLALMVWSRNVLAFPQIIETRAFVFLGASVTNVQLAILAICVTLMSGLALLVYRTPLGTAMRATAQNPQVAGLMGIDVNRVIAATFASSASRSSRSAIGGLLEGVRLFAGAARGVQHDAVVADEPAVGLDGADQFGKALVQCLRPLPRGVALGRNPHPDQVRQPPLRAGGERLRGVRAAVCQPLLHARGVGAGVALGGEGSD